jgi:hypothetical protein
MRLLSQNLQAVPLRTPRAVRLDVARTVNDAEHNAVIFWQESYPGYYQRAIRAVCGDRYAHYMPKGCEAAISWTVAHWERIGSGMVPLHKGRATVCKPRRIFYVILRNRQSGRTAVFTNRHYVAHAWCRHVRPFKAWRKRQWLAGHAADVALIRHFATEGYPVAGGGDYNRGTRPYSGAELSRDYRPLDYAHDTPGVDWLWTLDGRDACFHPLTARTLTPRGSDHDGRMAITALHRVGR